MKRFFIALMALCCFACTAPEYKITLTDPGAANQELKYTAASIPLGFEATNQWTASIVSQQPSGWLSVSPSSGQAGSMSIYLSVPENTGFDERTALVRIVCGSSSQDINVHQGVKNNIVAAADRVAVQAEGGDFSIDITANVEVKMTVDSDASWLHYKGTKAAQTSSYQFSADANALYGTREAGISFSSADGAITTRVIVSQASRNRSTSFDEGNIAVSFGVMSDTHLYDGTSAPAVKLQSALQQLLSRATASSGALDGVLIAGDFIDSGYAAQWGQLQAWKNIYESVLNPGIVPMVYCLGNHDVNGWMNNKGTMVSDAKNFRSIFGSAYYTTDKDTEAGENMECRHCQVAGYNVLCITPIGHTPVSYDTKAVEWLDKKLNEITTAEPDKFVIVLSHAMVQGTVYGSNLVSAGVWGDANKASYWYSTQLTPVLEKYPQAVIFGGHLHFPLNDPRSIWQGKFTAMGTASTRYMAFEGGTYYVNKAGGTTLTDKDEYSQGYLLQFDVNGNMRATRMDFYHKDSIGTPWEVAFPDPSGLSHLQKYNFANREAANAAPQLSSIEVEQRSSATAYVPCTLKFAAASDDEFAHHYEIRFTGNGYNTTAWLMSDFYLKPKTADMKREYSYTLGSLGSGTYEVSVVAVDSWGKSSSKLTKTFTVEGKSVDPSKLPDAYVDLSFKSDGITDAKGHVTVTNNGASVVQETFKHGSKSGKLSALATENSKYLACQFKDLGSSSDMQAFASGGFSVEAFFSDPSGSADATQAIICATEQGGWGLAERSSGIPYFIVGEDAYNKYKSVDATSTVSRTELTHIVGVYDAPSKSMRIYINGKLSQSTSISGSFYPGSGATCNQFCLGLDTCLADRLEYPCVNMRFVTAKIYSCALNDGQVDLAYKEALKLF